MRATRESALRRGLRASKGDVESPGVSFRSPTTIGSAEGEATLALPVGTSTEGCSHEFDTRTLFVPDSGDTGGVPSAAPESSDGYRSVSPVATTVARGTVLVRGSFEGAVITAAVITTACWITVDGADASAWRPSPDTGAVVQIISPLAVVLPSGRKTGCPAVEMIDGVGAEADPLISRALVAGGVSDGGGVTDSADTSVLGRR